MHKFCLAWTNNNNRRGMRKRDEWNMRKMENTLCRERQIQYVWHDFLLLLEPKTKYVYSFCHLYIISCILFMCFRNEIHEKSGQKKTHGKADDWERKTILISINICSITIPMNFYAFLFILKFGIHHFVSIICICRIDYSC